MPELPEVETIRSDLSRYALNKVITDVVIKKPKLIKGSARSLKQKLINNKIISLDRVGKVLIFKLKTGDFLLVHLKMTGQLIFKKGKKLIVGGHSDGQDFINLPNKYTHIWLTFKDGSKLFFNDLRQFGYWSLINKSELNKLKSRFGLNPLDKEFNGQSLYYLIQNRSTSLKAVLLNQNLIAGIGNIYADEACFLSRLKPDRPAKSLSLSDCQELAKSIKKLLKKSIKYRGTTFNNFRDADGRTGNFLKFLKVYHRHNEPCLICQNKIHRLKVAGRGTHLCPYCQK